MKSLSTKIPSGPQRRTTALAVLLLSLCVVAGWCWLTYRSARDGAIEAADDLEVTQQLVVRVDQLRRRPSIASAGEMQQTELTRRIELAAKQAQIDGDQIVRIWPESARRLENSPYREKPTQVLLKGVSMKQALQFLHGLTADASGGLLPGGLRVQSVRFSAPRDSDRSDAWIVETTLTYLIFDPTQPNTKNAQGHSITTLSDALPSRATSERLSKAAVPE